MCADGCQQELAQKRFSFDDLCQLVGGIPEVVECPTGLVLVLNLQGKLLLQPVNFAATYLLRANVETVDFIVGDVLVCDKSELPEHLY